jgi:hypothetical protein
VRIRTLLSHAALISGTAGFFWLLIPVERDPLGMPLIRNLYGYDPAMEAAFAHRTALRDTARALEQRLARAELQALAREFTADRLLDLIVIADTSSSERDRETTEAVARAELAALGVARPLSPVRVVVSSTEPRTTFPAYRRAVVLPEAPGAPCVVALQELGPPRPLRILGYDRILGTCAFYAKFGEPGEGMREWLRESGVRRASYLQRPEHVSAGRVTDNAEINSLVRVPYIGTCRVGILPACDSLFAAIGGERSIQSWARDAVAVADPVTNVLLTVPNTFGGPSAPFTFGLLAGLAEQLGDERFRDWWTGDGDPNAGYRRVAGVSLSEGVHQLLTAKMSEYDAGPTVTLAQWLAALVVIGAAFGLAVRVSKPALT